MAVKDSPEPSGKGSPRRQGPQWKSPQRRQRRSCSSGHPQGSRLRLQQWRAPGSTEMVDGKPVSGRSPAPPRPSAPPERVRALNGSVLAWAPGISRAPEQSTSDVESDPTGA